MKKAIFKIKFIGEYEVTEYETYTLQQAMILATASRIRSALHADIEYIETQSGKKYYHPFFQIRHDGE